MGSWLARGVGNGMIDIAHQQFKESNMERDSALQMQRQEMLDDLRAKRADAERKKIGSVIEGSRGKAVEAEGPPNPDGSRPTANMSEREEMLAEYKALSKSGYHNEANDTRRRLSEYDREQIMDKRYENERIRNDRRADQQDKREERMAAAQERSLDMQGASQSRAERELAMREGDHKRAMDSQGMIAGYKVAQSQGNKDAATIYLEQSLARGVDPRQLDKNDPLSSQVSAAKATLASMDATDEQKAAALQVLDLSNKSFVDRKSGSQTTPADSSGKVKVNGKVMDYSAVESGKPYTAPDGTTRIKK